MSLGVNSPRKLIHRQLLETLGCAQPNVTFALLTYCGDEVENRHATLRDELRRCDLLLTSYSGYDLVRPIGIRGLIVLRQVMIHLTGSYRRVPWGPFVDTEVFWIGRFIPGARRTVSENPERVLPP